MSRPVWRNHMTDTESRRGMVFFLLYLFLFPYVNAWVQRLTLHDAETPVAEANVIYYAVIFALCLALFWSFLRDDFAVLGEAPGESLLAILKAFAAGAVVQLALKLLPLPVADPIPQQYAAEFSAAPVPTLVLVLLLIPLAEETMFRGLLFGQFRGYDRALAWALSLGIGALGAVWRYALEYSDPRYLLLAVLYLPTAVACTWCYEECGSVWATTVIHAGLNGVALVGAI